MGFRQRTRAQEARGLMTLDRYLIYPQENFRSLGLFCSQHPCRGDWKVRTYGEWFSMDGPEEVFSLWVRATDLPNEYGVWFPVLVFPDSLTHRDMARAETERLLAALLDRRSAAVVAREGWLFP